MALSALKYLSNLILFIFYKVIALDYKYLIKFLINIALLSIFLRRRLCSIVYKKGIDSESTNIIKV